MRAALWVIAILLGVQVCLSAVVVARLQARDKAESVREARDRKAEIQARIDRLRGVSGADNPNSQVSKWIADLERERDAP